MLCVLPATQSGPHQGSDKYISGYHSSGKIRVASRRCTAVSVAPPGGETSTDSRFFVLSVPLFRSLMLTPMHSGVSSVNYAQCITV